MKTRTFTRAASGALLLLLAASAVLPRALRAQDATPDTVRLAELERRIEALSRELERQRLGEEVVVADTSIGGFGLGASKVYRVQEGVSIGGYGEILYENYASELEDGTPSTRRDQADALRAIVYLGYKFNDRVLFNSEIEIEHGNEAFLEFGYLDLRLTENVGLRGGLLLAPIGLVNELHEPPIFLGTKRSQTESRIIPTTWRENGIGVFGDTDKVSWRVYLMNGLNGAKFSADGFRGGRQKGSKALAEDFGLAARFDWVGTPGLMIGGSIYRGGSDQGADLSGAEVDGGMTIWEAHADWKRQGLWVRALWAGASVADPVGLNQLAGRAPGSGASGVAERMNGGYLHLGYDLLHGRNTAASLIPFLTIESIDTQATVADGYVLSQSARAELVEVGLAFRPVQQAVVKAGMQLWGNDARTGNDQFNIQLGWLF